MKNKIIISCVVALTIVAAFSVGAWWQNKSVFQQPSRMVSPDTNVSIPNVSVSTLPSNDFGVISSSKISNKSTSSSLKATSKNSPTTLVVTGCASVSGYSLTSGLSCDGTSQCSTGMQLNSDRTACILTSEPSWHTVYTHTNKDDNGLTIVKLTPPAFNIEGSKWRIVYSCTPLSPANSFLPDYNNFRIDGHVMIPVDENPQDDAFAISPKTGNSEHFQTNCLLDKPNGVALNETYFVYQTGSYQALSNVSSQYKLSIILDRNLLNYSIEVDDFY